MFAVVKCIATILSLALFIDRAGRRNLLLTSSVGIAFALWYIGGFITATSLNSNVPHTKTIAGWIAIVCVYVYAVSNLVNPFSRIHWLLTK